MQWLVFSTPFTQLLGENGDERRNFWSWYKLTANHIYGFEFVPGPDFFSAPIFNEDSLPPTTPPFCEGLNAGKWNRQYWRGSC